MLRCIVASRVCRLTYGWPDHTLANACIPDPSVWDGESPWQQVGQMVSTQNRSAALMHLHWASRVESRAHHAIVGAMCRHNAAYSRAPNFSGADTWVQILPPRQCGACNVRLRGVGWGGSGYGSRLILVVGESVPYSCPGRCS